MSTGRPGYLLNPHTKQFQFYGRYTKPGYQSSTDTFKVVVKADANRPAFFIIGGQVFTVTSDLTCTLAVNGVGGIVNGNLAASTLYYLYAVNSSGSPALVADIRSPENSNGNGGPEGFVSWTYLGAFPTNASSQAFVFRSSNGMLVCDTSLEQVTHGTTTVTAVTFSFLPTTARFARVELRVDGNGHDGWVLSSGTSTDQSSLRQRAQVQASFGHGFVPVLTANTLYLDVSNNAAEITMKNYGWIEDPSEWI